MTKLKHFKVTALPGTLFPDAIYFVANGTYAETYVTDSSGVAKMVGNSTMINNLITTELANLNTTEIVADITVRDALTSTLNKNTIVYVIDATGDPTVVSGAASYLFNNSNDTWYQINDQNKWLDFLYANTSTNYAETSETINLEGLDRVGKSSEIIFEGSNYKKFTLDDGTQSYILSTTNQIIKKRYN